MASTSRTSSKSVLPQPYETRAAEPQLGKQKGAPLRTSKTSQKLKVLPEQPEIKTQSQINLVDDIEEEDEDSTPTDDEGGDEEERGVEVYNQIAQIPAGTARKDAARLTKKEKAKLPRVTAYCTATTYRLDDLMKFFHARHATNRTNPRKFDEVIYTPYTYAPPEPTTPAAEPPVADLLGIEGTGNGGDVVSGDEVAKKKKKRSRFDKGEETETGEIFCFEYGAVVIWGMSEVHERRFLSSLKRFEEERLAAEDIEKEELNYYYAQYSRIYNDVIALRRGSSYMTKLSLSHALAQSVKISLFEELITSTIDDTKDIPEIISESGKIGMKHADIMQQIGQLFILRININLVGSVLDSPELFWTYPDLEPLYAAFRQYLEIPQRIDLLNQRVEVLQDMLQLLKETVSNRHAERLEQIVIVLIGIEIVLGLATIFIDLFA
ncbi:DUF155-domain-containing protein [Dacryopinax primogenitus]|uniref:DUF155-domain-containing protein n=1 Tax=Dacryopinax primogenitus (strain DJM 731) TaxID=1858805 RepID=M5FT96_DACPD|nr:DUF155-domain-containing protein [Dacryopinax primogenitus]EJT99243.1 DUF155-domain-containing protein [Dacryopinax primogenitus]